MKNVFYSALISLSILCLSLTTLPQNALAFTLIQPPGLGIKVEVGSSTTAENLLETIIVNVINIFFSIGGIGVVVYFVWGAVDWIFSGGDKEKVANARKKMTHAIIGLVLLSLSFVLINLIGQIIGFNPLGYLQIRSLESPGNPIINQDLGN